MYLFVLGAGLGFTMQVVVTAVQNAVDRRDLGAATSSVAFFRSMGGAFGTALFGAVLNSRLADHLADTTGVVGGGGEAELATSVQVNQDLPEPVKGQVVEAFVLSLHDVFLSAVPFGSSPWWPPCSSRTGTSPTTTRRPCVATTRCPRRSSEPGLASLA